MDKNIHIVPDGTPHIFITAWSNDPGKEGITGQTFTHFPVKGFKVIENGEDVYVWQSHASLYKAHCEILEFVGEENANPTD